MPVHLFGNPCNMSKILSIAKKYKLKIIEDACLATGAEYKNEKVGSLGDLTVFSTNPGKVLDGIGPGGIITTNNKNLFLKLKQLRDYGRKEKPGKWPVKSHIVGFNSKLSTINAAILNIRLKDLDHYVQRRNEVLDVFLNNGNYTYTNRYGQSETLRIRGSSRSNPVLSGSSDDYLEAQEIMRFIWEDIVAKSEGTNFRQLANEVLFYEISPVNPTNIKDR